MTRHNEHGKHPSDSVLSAELSEQSRSGNHTPGSRLNEAFQNYVCDLFFFSLAVLIITKTPYYKTYIVEQARNTILWIYYAYFLAGIPYYYFLSGPSGPQPARTRIIIGGILDYFASYSEYLNLRLKGKKTSPPAIAPEVKVSLLFIMVKFYFLPLMLMFVFDHLNGLKNFAALWPKVSENRSLLNNEIFLALINVLFFVDTLYFSFGYVFESKYLKNEVRSVEPTFFGWAVALACYPPFNGFVGHMYSWAKNDLFEFPNPVQTTVFRVGILLCTCVYVWATLALGTKCSNLTNRGIVDRGPYAFVRHPAYIAKNLSWWIMTIPFLTQPAVIGAGIAWSTIYFLRALTEERHLSKDPDYVEYCKKVKWRFIPFIY